MVTKTYQCGTTATGQSNMPDHCPDHGKSCKSVTPPSPAQAAAGERIAATQEDTQASGRVTTIESPALAATPMAAGEGAGMGERFKCPFCLKVHKVSFPASCVAATPAAEPSATPRPDLNALTCIATRDANFGTRLKAALEITEYTEKLERELTALRADCDALRERLEMVWAYDSDGNKIPAPEGMPDGISCRDETIRAQNAVIDALRAERDFMRKTILNSGMREDVLNSSVRLALSTNAAGKGE